MWPDRVTLRRGLPRTPGGEPWPNLGPSTSDAVQQEGVTEALAIELSVVSAPAAVCETDAAAPSTPRPVESLLEGIPSTGRALRRGLPRVIGDGPWPPHLAAPAFYPMRPSIGEPQRQGLDGAASEAIAAEPSSIVTVETGAGMGDRDDLRASAAPSGEVRRYGRYTARQWVGAGALVVAGLVAVAVAVVLLARWVLTLEPVAEFVTLYPGEYRLPVGAPVGIPAWLAWQHFFNAFLMVLIIRSGLALRTEKKPPAVWISRRAGAQKVSLTVWFHQSLDLLWLLNGTIFIVLLIVTGQWMRIVPTSLEVFPNAASAVLQYLSLDWPTENGWVNYNSLQQLAYFVTIFVAAPLAVVTGFRLSGLWPSGAERLSHLYPMRWARRLHFPVMLYFVLFIVVHVALVLSTGALRNLNHMYAAQGSVDPTAYADNWTGFWMLLLSITAMVAALVAARPVVLAPIARLFGTVAAR